MPRIPCFLALSLGLSGCAVTSADGVRMGPGSDEFAAYVERVFRLQNEVSSELGLALEDEPPATEHYEALEAAELELFRACVGLTELAEERQDGATPGGLGALKRARGAPDCERATETAAELLR